MQTRWLSAQEGRAWLAFRRMRSRLDLQIARDLTRDTGLSEADYDVLSNLSEAPGDAMRVQELAGLMHWSSSRLAHQVTRMQQRDLVRRENLASDGRGSLIRLTAAGRARLEQAAPLHVASVRKHFIDLLSPAEVTILADVSARVSARLAQE
ncbi:MAG: MarR family winged helix-turn-helix transcriptional regulator [Angustibacter sp.]